MICKIADLYTVIPESGDLTERCQPYLADGKHKADIVIDEKDFGREELVYLDSGFLFYRDLLHFDGMMLHASAVAYEGRAYLFSGPCGMGKSTHTRLWQEVFGTDAIVFNDDKPALRRLDGRWFAYGTPWCGKDGINVNMKVPLGGICFLRRGEENSIRRLYGMEAAQNVMSQTLRRFVDVANLNLMLAHTERLITEIPVFELKNLPVPEAARLSYETMHRAAEEVGL